MRALWVARKSLIEILREPQLLGLVIALPLIFVAITAVTYTGALLVTHPVLVLDLAPEAAGLRPALAAERYADGRPVFALEPVTDRAAAEAALEEGEATALLVIEPGPAGTPLPRVTIKGDALNPRFYRASTILEAAINRYGDALSGRVDPVRVVQAPIYVVGPETEFDLYAPGMMIFGWLMLIPQTAMLVAREVRWKTLRRLRLTRLSALDLLLGVSLAQLVVAVAQVVLVLVAAEAMGFHNRGSLALATGIGLAVSLSAIGLGLIVACFTDNDSQAANVGSTLTMLQVFLSGAFYQMPPLTVFTLLGHEIDLFDVFPATHGFMALQGALSYGGGLAEVGFRLAATLVLSVVYLAAGVVVFRRVQMRSQG